MVLKGKNDKNNLYLKNGKNNEVLVFEIFVDDIIFGEREYLCKSFANEMKKEFEMSLFGEIKLFFGLQVCQVNFDIFITQSKYIKEILKTFVMEGSRPMRKPMSTEHKLSKNDDSTNVN